MVISLPSLESENVSLLFLGLCFVLIILRSRCPFVLFTISSLHNSAVVIVLFIVAAIALIPYFANRVAESWIEWKEGESYNGSRKHIILWGGGDGAIAGV